MSDVDTPTGGAREGGGAVLDDPAALRTANVISGLLRWGVRVSLALFVAGSVLAFVRPGGYGSAAADVRQLTGPAGSFPRTFGWLADGIAAGRGVPIVVAGLLMLLVTPVLRVLVSIAVFAAQRDRIFSAITVGVFALLLLSFILGHAAD